MRAADCAAGKFFAFLDLLLGVAYGTLLSDARVAALSDADRSAVLGDFAAARRHVVFTLGIKMAHWGQLPWKLFGLAHPETTVARECGRRALALYAAAGDTFPHHWLTAVLMTPGSFARA
eukprot:12441727-Alexandrium_andersonii.AAC.1